MDEDEFIMELDDVRRLYKSMYNYKISTRILQHLWHMYSNDQCAIYMIVDDITIKQFKIWLESGNPDDAYT